MASLTQVTWKKRDARDAKLIKRRNKRARIALQRRAVKEVKV